MKVGIFEHLVRAGATRRDVLKGAASMAALAAASTGTLGALTRQASAQDNLRAEILKIPGVGKGSPTDADWQKVGELCLGATKASVKEGEFAGVELTFMGLNNQNLHNFLFRGFLAPWEAYTGAKISWIDLAQADYNARLQQSIATGTVRLRHHRDGRALRRRHRQQGPARRDARLGGYPDRSRRPRELPQASGGHLGRQDLPHQHRWRLPHLRLPQGLFRRRLDHWDGRGAEVLG